MDDAARSIPGDLVPGTRVGRYEVLELLARGGMAEIYLVKSVGIQGFETLSVLKRLPPACVICEPTLVNMFFDEARLASLLRHPNIAQVFDIGEDKESYFFVMEYIEGINLRSVIKRCKARGIGIPFDCAIQIALGLAAGLHAAHEARGADGRSLDVVHRDVSPHNVVVTVDGTIKLIDFGIAKFRARLTHTQTGIVKGKFAYMSPEQCRAMPVDRRSDLFSLGTLLFELTTMSRPHGNSFGPELLHSIAEQNSPDPSTRLPGYPQGLAEIVNGLLQRDPQKRYQTARELHDSLSAFAVASRMPLSPYRLASWVSELTSDETVSPPPAELSAIVSRYPPGDTASPRMFPRASTRACTVPFNREVLGDMEIAGEPELEDFLRWQAQQECEELPEAPARLARGTELPEDECDQDQEAATGRRATSLPYEEIAIRASTVLQSGSPRWWHVSPRRVLLISLLAALLVAGGVVLLHGGLDATVAIVMQEMPGSR